MAANLIIGEVIVIHVEDSLPWTRTAALIPENWKTIARLGAIFYCRTLGTSSNKLALGEPGTP